MDKKIIVITGATASGKTKISINLAKKINAEIICADSRIVYKDLDIVSAKPNIEEQDNIKHHLIDIVSPMESFSAGDFVELANKKIEEISSRNKNIIICGGTWFYVKSLLDEKMLPECPIDEDLRQELNKFDSMSLWNKLKEIDEARALLIHPNNKDKIIRSIEMCRSINGKISEYQRKDNKNYDALWYMPYFEREELYQRINKRVDIMMDLGLYQEWEQNKNKYPDSLIMKNTIGYSEFFDLDNKKYSTIDEAVGKIKQYTRNFAKRQLTYFKSNNEIKLIKNEDDIINDIKNI